MRDLSRVQFDNNKYVFSDMFWIPPNGGGRTIFELYNNLGLKQFDYSPQKPFGQGGAISITVGSNITLNDFKTVVPHPDNCYQWQKKDGPNILGATNRSLTITDAGDSDAGIYQLIVTNPGVPDLTLKSEEIIIQVNYANRE